MPCYKPLVAVRKSQGGVAVLRRKRYAELDVGEFVVSCGQCIGCRLDHSKSWAVRSVHESRMHKLNSFLTLTYNEDEVPWDFNLNPDHHTKFMKRLRKHSEAKYGLDIRYYMCGEYGSDRFHPVTGELLSMGRPHYHYLIFGWYPRDAQYLRTHRGHHYYRSEELEKLWPYGYSVVGHVTPETCAYTARYVLKKQTGKESIYEPKQNYVEGYGLVDRLPEFSRMSLKPGIGASWFAKYGKQDVYDSGDFVVIGGSRYSTPRYYDTLMERLDVDFLTGVKEDRARSAAEYESNNTYERLLVREEVHKIKARKLIRGYENGTTDTP